MNKVNWWNNTGSGLKYLETKLC